MNAFQASQTSGNNSIEQTVIHEPAQRHDARSAGPFSASGFLWRAERPTPRQEGVAVLEGYERDMAVFQAEHEEALRNIKMHFVLDADGSAVIAFLNDHRTIPQFLLEAVEPLTQSFGPATNFTLKAPIEDDGRSMLYVIAPWSGPVEDARQALSRFDNTWWLEHAYQASGYLTFTYELI